MGASKERRRAIMEVLCARRHETRGNLAFEFGVSKRTIEYDVQSLSLEYPIYTTQGRGGGIHVVAASSYSKRSGKSRTGKAYRIGRRKNAAVMTGA